MPRHALIRLLSQTGPHYAYVMRELPLIQRTFWLSKLDFGIFSAARKHSSPFFRTKFLRVVQHLERVFYLAVFRPRDRRAARANASCNAGSALQTGVPTTGTDERTLGFLAPLRIAIEELHQPPGQLPSQSFLSNDRARLM